MIKGSSRNGSDQKSVQLDVIVSGLLHDETRKPVCAIRISRGVIVGMSSGTVELYTDGAPQLLLQSATVGQERTDRQPLALAWSHSTLLVADGQGVTLVPVPLREKSWPGRRRIDNVQCCAMRVSVSGWKVVSLRWDDEAARTIMKREAGSDAAEPTAAEVGFRLKHLTSVQSHLVERLQKGIGEATNAAVNYETKERLHKRVIESIVVSCNSVAGCLALPASTNSRLHFPTGDLHQIVGKSNENWKHTLEDADSKQAWQPMVELLDFGHTLYGNDVYLWVQIRALADLEGVTIGLLAADASILGQARAVDVTSGQSTVISAILESAPAQAAALTAFAVRPIVHQHLTWLMDGIRLKAMPVQTEADPVRSFNAAIGTKARTWTYTATGDASLLKTRLHSLEPSIESHVYSITDKISHVTLTCPQKLLHYALSHITTIPNLILQRTPDREAPAQILTQLETERGPADEADTDKAVSNFILESLTIH